MPIELQKVAQKDIYKKLEEQGVVRAGCSIDPKRRKDEYEREGYVGAMYYAETENMKTAENRLLDYRDYRHNVQKSSNAQEKAGYIYVIQGRKMEKKEPVVKIRIDIKEVKQEVIFDMIEKPGVVRGGCTIDPYRRKAEYEREGYIGTMYIATTKNMKKAEDRLLAARDFRHNVQRSSNAQEIAGYIYIIQGRKMEKK